MDNKYTTQNFKFGKYEFRYAHWSHRYVSKKNFTYDEIQTQTKYLSEGDVVIDIGGFSGDTPILYANAVGTSGKVIAFEPNPHSFDILKVNSEINEHLNIHPVNKAITEEAGTYTFHYSDSEYCNGGFASEIDFGVGATGHVVPLDVSGVNLSNWIDENLTQDEVNRISFIKIDTEGYDYKILRSNKELFTKIRPILEIELYPALSIREVEEMYNTLTEIGYGVFKQENSRDCSLESLSRNLTLSQFISLFKNIRSGEDIVAHPLEKIPKNKKMLTKKDISFIQPSRNNLKYLKWSYESIRKNAGEDPTICVADDFSNDGTWEWCQEMMESDPNFKAIRNEGPTRLGHTILYDRLINEVAPTKIVGIYHADMYLCPGALESVLEHIGPHKVVSLTRIEPPLHPDGPEKVLMDWKTEPEDFDEEKFLGWFSTGEDRYKHGKTTEGIFAPWFLFKEDFQSIGGHDPLYAPQSKEDSDIFNRFLLNGYEFIQTWDGCVYHMTCRGSRYNPTLTEVGKESDEWLAQNVRSTRNFIRKWGHFVKHDKMMKPVVPHKYDVEFKISNSDARIINILEPWCSRMTVDCSEEIINEYIQLEQPNTQFDLTTRFNQTTKSDIVVEFDARSLTQNSFNFIQNLSEIFDFNEFESGEYEFDIFKVKVNRVKHYEDKLVKL